jgi:hypothetical protein
MSTIFLRYDFVIAGSRPAASDLNHVTFFPQGAGFGVSYSGML